MTVGAARSLKAADDRLAIGAEVELMTWDTAPTVGASGAVVEDLGGPTRLGVTVGAIYTLTTTEGVRVTARNCVQRRTLVRHDEQMSDEFYYKG